MHSEPIHIWIGCTTKVRLSKTIHSLEKILQSLDAKYEFIDGDIDICCGSVLFNTGQRRRALDNAKKVRRVLQERNVSNLSTPCPGCFRTFKEFYQEAGIWRFNSVKHTCELLAEHIDRLRFESVERLPVTYHDPCHLGRHAGVFEAPRKILAALPNVAFYEMKHNKENSFCCGSGAGVRIFHKELADYASALKLMEAAQYTNAHYLVTACPFCEHSFLSAQSAYEIDTPIVINIIDLVHNLLAV